MKRVLTAILLIMAFCFTMRMESLAEDNRYYYATSERNVYEHCHIKSKVLGTLGKNEIVYAINYVADSSNTAWVLAETQYGIGYVQQKDLEQYQAGEEIEEENHRVSVAYFACANAEVRYTNSKNNSKVYHTLPFGTELLVVAMYPTKDEGTWAAIRIDGGTGLGFISVQDIQKSNGKAVSNLPYLVRAKEDLITYSESGSVGETSCVIVKGTELSVEYYVQYTNGTIMAKCDNEEYDVTGFVDVTKLEIVN